MEPVLPARSRSTANAFSDLATEDWRRIEWACAVALAAVVLVMATLASNGAIAGLYHDDGIYLATSKAVADGRGYRLVNLPDAPWAAKYPPLYPILLSGVWRLLPEFPDNLGALKAINAAMLALLVLVTAAWLRQFRDLGSPMRIATLVLVATAPSSISFGDLVLSEPLFTALLVGTLAAVAAWEEAGRRPPWLAVAALLAGLSFLARTIGLTVCAALLVYVLVRDWRRAVFPAAIMAVLAGPWLVWARTASGQPNPLLEYYVVYETSAWALLFRAPGLVLEILTANVALYVEELSLVFGFGPWWLTVAAVGMAALGAGTIRRRGPAPWIVAIVAGLYVLAVLGHPYPMARYLAPLTPIMFAAFGIGTVTLYRRVGPIALLPALFVLYVHGAWLAHFQTTRGRGIHAEFGRLLVHDWKGFEETMAWVDTSTPPRAVLASWYDALYFIYTGRPGLRPWLHDPDTYRALRGAPRSSGSWILRHLREAGVEYLVVDPVLLGVDGDYARESMASVLESGGDHWSLRFTSSNGHHRVYQWVESERSLDRRLHFELGHGRNPGLGPTPSSGDLAEKSHLSDHRSVEAKDAR